MTILAIETSTPVCSVALKTTCRTVSRDARDATTLHADNLLVWIDDLLEQCAISRTAITGIAVSCGPGTFTGVRSGISIAQAIALGLGCPVLAVSSLHVLAMRADSTASSVMVCTDARIGEVYVGFFQRNQDMSFDACGVERLCTPEDVVVHAGCWYGVGNGFAIADNFLQEHWASQLQHVDASAIPEAKDLCAIAAHPAQSSRWIDPQALTPVYLRQQVALTIAQRRMLQHKRQNAP